MQALLDGLLLLANRLAQKVKRLKLALNDLEEVSKGKTPMTTEEKAELERKVKHHTAALKVAIDELEDEIELAKQKLWAEAKPENGEQATYAEMAVTGESADGNE